MDELNVAAEQIGTMTIVISEIADQINLPSHNATIEDASAGGAGRGIAVVATEVEELFIENTRGTA